MAITLSGVGSKTAAGAAAGSVFGPWGTAIGGAGGALWGLIDGASSGDGGQAAVDAAGKEKLARMAAATRILGDDRLRRRQEGMNALANRMGAYQGANNVLASMYGRSGAMAPNINLASGGPRMGPAPPPPPELPSRMLNLNVPPSALRPANQPRQVPMLQTAVPPGALSPAIQRMAAMFTSPGAR